MAIPNWTYPSNSSLGIFSERIPVTIPVLVFDSEDRSTIETQQFENNIDSTILPNYSDNSFFYIKTNGLAKTPWIGAPEGYNRYSPKEQSYVFKLPRDGVTVNGERAPVLRHTPNTIALGFVGVAIDGVPFKSPNSQIVANISGQNYTENSVIYPLQDFFVDGSGIIGKDRKFYYQTDPKLIYNKNSNSHSPIIGYAFDGNPIYGPYGFSDPYDPTSSIKVMETSYKLSEVQRDSGTIPDGTFIEDFIYEKGLGDLDEHNGRFCETPEYPGGTYAYFVTVDPNDTTLVRYPYIIGPTYYNEPLLPNGSFNFPGEITLSLISGKLPPGLSISGLTIKGIPFEVNKTKTFRFVLRATNVSGISDRTYSITIEGADAPVWITPAGDLELTEPGSRTEDITKTLALTATSGQTLIKTTSVFKVLKNSIVSSKNFKNSIKEGTRVDSIDLVNKTLKLSQPLQGTIPLGEGITFSYTYVHHNLYILDNSPVDYQFNATDNDLSTGEKLTYFIPPKGGFLPPGLELTPDGRLTGFTRPILSADTGGSNGNYDMQLYDKYAYDYGVRPYNGFDSFLFDNQTYDYYDSVITPKKLNIYYQFIVRVTDGLSYSDRKFRIFIVGDDHLRADNTVMQVGTGTFTADVTYLRNPIWLTGKAVTDSNGNISYYLGRRRANNYITTFLDVYESSTLQGTIGYILDPYNNDGSKSELPPGMKLDSLKGEIYGDVPYQPAVTKKYKFTVRAIRYDPQSAYYNVEKKITETGLVGQTIIKVNNILDLRVGSFVTSSNVEPGSTIVNINKSNSTVTISTPLQKTANIGDKIIFSYIVSSSRTFSLDIMGEVDSTIKFLSPGDLGSIPANFVSNLFVEAKTTVPDAVLTYTLVGGSLPPGLTLFSDGTIQGKVNQYATEDTPGLTTFDDNLTVFDDSATKFDREFKFIILAQDQYLYSAVTKIFTVLVTTPNDLLYSNIFVKPFLDLKKRQRLVNFFTDPTVFEMEKLYRPSDFEFGVQSDLKMLIYAGIERKKASYYASALGRSYRKKYRFGSIKKATAKVEGTNTVLYEVIYIEMLEDMENSKGSIPSLIDIKYQNHIVKTDQGKRDSWDSDFGITKYTSGINIANQNLIKIDSVNGLKIGLSVYIPPVQSYFSPGSVVTSINSLTNTITINNPILNQIPENTEITFDYDNLTRSNEDVLPRIWTQDKTITVDYDGQNISDENKSNVFGNSTTNIREKFKILGETERNYLPLWMRTAQTFSGVEQGFTKAVVLCYCKPGYADDILLNIKNYFKIYKETENMDFLGNINFTVDRVIIDSVEGNVGNKYIAFAAREIING